MPDKKISPLPRPFKARPSFHQIASRILAISTVFLLGVSHGGTETCHSNPELFPSYERGEEVRRADKKVPPLLYRSDFSAHPYGEADGYPDGWVVPKNKNSHIHKAFKVEEETRDLDFVYRSAQESFAFGMDEDGWKLVQHASRCGHVEATILLFEKNMKDNNQEDALMYLKRGIDIGIPKAKHIIAEQYEKGGLGLSRDYHQAFGWYYLAAKDGFPPSMAAVGYYFARGLHGVQDDYAAIHWYHAAARLGHIESMTAYGWMLMSGKGVNNDSHEA